jgi:hypothetical protein
MASLLTNIAHSGSFGKSFLFSLLPSICGEKRHTNRNKAFDKKVYSYS